MSLSLFAMLDKQEDDLDSFYTVGRIPPVF